MAAVYQYGTVLGTYCLLGTLPAVRSHGIALLCFTQLMLTMILLLGHEAHMSRATLGIAIGMNNLAFAST
jgi:hypothetical protein